MLRLLPLLIITTFPLVGLALSSGVCSLVLPISSFDITFVFVLHMLLSIVILLYGNILGALLIDQYLAHSVNLSVLRISLHIFRGIVYTSIVLNIANAIVLVYRQNYAYIALCAMTGMVDGVYIACIQDIQRETDSEYINDEIDKETEVAHTDKETEEV